MRVLVVDDNQLTRDMLRECLTKAGHEAAVACTGRLGLVEMRAAAPPDFVILDMVMPDMDGAAVLREMRADPALRGVPTLVLTACPKEDVDALEGEFPGLWVAQKPVDRDGLLSLVKGLEEAKAEKAEGGVT